MSHSSRRLASAVLFVLLVLVAAGVADAAARQAAPPADTTDAFQGKQAIEDLSLEDLLSREIRGGESGSYGARLAEYEVHADVHGYVTTDFLKPVPEGVSTFDLHHTVLMVRASLSDRVLPEFGLEWDHGGSEFYIPFAIVDLVASPLAIVRVGYFVVPLGVFNEYQYPDFLRKTVGSPIAMREIVPALWSEVGVQLRGKAEWADARGVNYAVYVVNGLEQRDPDPADGAVAEGSSIREMRRNLRDQRTSGKAIGGRIGATLGEGVDVGVSGYTGSYTADGGRRLSIVDVDFTLRRAALTVRAEGAAAFQEVAGDDYRKSGAYVLVAHRTTRAFEPYVQIEAVDLDGTPEPRRRGALAGAVLYPFPDEARGASLKLEGGATWVGDAGPDGLLAAQLTLAF